MTNSKKLLKEMVSKINQGLPYYEKGWISVQRYPDSEKIRPESFQEYIEIRFNFEASQVPVLADAVLKSEGRLFSCIELEGADETRRRFNKATVKLLDVEDIPDEFSDLKLEIINLRNLLGGDKISFNSVKRKIRLNIYE